ncbi:MAG: PAS domain S-box protein [Acidobacteriaceae bacterium]
MNQSDPQVRRMVLVDGNTSSLGATLRRLPGLGAEIYEASTDQDALKLVGSLCPDLVLVNAQLPDGSGMDVAEKIKANSVLRATLVIGIIEGLLENQEQQEVFGALTDGMITLPISDANLLSQLRSYLRFQKIAENLLNEQRRLQNTQRSFHVGNWELDIEANHLVWSDDVYRIVGLQKSQFDQKTESYFSLVHPDDRAGLQAGWEKALRGEAPLDIEHRIVRPNGEVRYVHKRAERFVDEMGGRNLLSGVILNITDRKLLEQKLRESERQLSMIYEHMHDIVFYLDVESGDQFRFASVNPAFLKATGLTADQVIGKRMQEVIPEPARTMVLEHYKVAVRDGETVFWEETSVYPAGEKHAEVSVTPIFDAQGVCRNLVGAVHDITESRRAELALQQALEQQSKSEAQYRLLFEQNPHPMFVYAISTLRFLAVNRATVERYGYTEQEFLSMRLHDIHLPEDIAQMEVDVRRPKFAAVAAKVWRHRKKDGSLIMAEISADFIDFNGEPARLVLASDVTEKLVVQHNLARVSRAQRMLSKCNEALIHAEEEQTLLTEICRISVEIGGYRMAWVGFALEDEAKTVFPAAHAGANNGYLEAVEISWDENRSTGRGPAGEAIRTGKVVIAEDFASDKRFRSWVLLALCHGFRGSVSLPLRNKEQTFGMLCLYVADVVHISEDEIRILQELADDLAFGISNIRAQQQQRKFLTSVL